EIKYFSGTASYDKTFEVPAFWLGVDQSIEIDLGSVKTLAEIIVNGVSAGIVWKRPFRTDITTLLHLGNNHLSVRVTNLWPNRLIGDKQPGSTPIAMTTFNPYAADSPLLPSGLLGPVQLMRSRAKKAP